MREIFDRAQIKLADKDQLRVRVTCEGKARPEAPGNALPLLGRRSSFSFRDGRISRFPREAFSLAPDEFCVIPAGLPHGEIVHADATLPFRNLVAGFYNNTLSLHFAYEARPHHPDIEVIEFF